MLGPSAPSPKKPQSFHGLPLGASVARLGLRRSGDCQWLGPLRGPSHQAALGPLAKRSHLKRRILGPILYYSSFL